MIRLRNRGQPPPKLARNLKKWTERWLIKQMDGGDWATPEAKRVIRQALLELSHGKCAYCEQTLNASSLTEIDHYTARSLRPDLAFEWTNLLPTCSVCNNRKRGQDHHDLLLKPDNDDPEPSLWLDFSTGRLRPNPRRDHDQQARAQVTIDTCDLNRRALARFRLDFLERVAQLAGRSKAADAELRGLMHPEAQFKFVLRRTLEVHRAAQLAQDDRDRFQA
jgi:uncharacterized protein (TIGR02646 family)